MNIILFEEHELATPLPLEDRRARHILLILKCQPGQSFDVGLLNGPKGKASILAQTPAGLQLSFSWVGDTPLLYPVTLAVGISRPQTVRKILSEVTALGVQNIIFLGTEKGEKSYLESKLWSQEEYKQYIRAGAEQSFSTRLPEIKVWPSVEKYLHVYMENLICPVVETERYVLDNYEAATRLTRVQCTKPAAILAIGAERGWSARERQLWREYGFTLVQLGERVLRTETACVAGLSLLLAKMDLF